MMPNLYIHHKQMVEIPVKENVKIVVRCHECASLLKAELEWHRGWVLHVHPCHCAKG
jgi:hypothetical protein